MRLVLPVLLLAGAAVPVAAQAPPATRAEARAWVRSEFGRSDVNRDGVLSRGEVTRAVNRNYGRLSMGRSRIMTNMWFVRMDKDKSNSVTRREAQGANDEFWGRFDRNRDGRLGPREREAAGAFLRNPAR